MGQSRTGVVQGSALASHDSSATPVGSRVYVIRGPHNHVNELAWVGSSWNTTDLPYATGAPSAIAGSALASHDSGGSRVYFISSDSHVHELAWFVNQQSQGSWNTTDLTANAKDSNSNTPPPPITGSALASHDSSGSRVYFIGSDNHVHELAWLVNQQGQLLWNTTDLTANAKDGNGNTPPPPITGSALASHDSGGSRVYFIGSDNHVHELAWLVNQQGQLSWNTTDLTANTKDGNGNTPPPPITGSALASHDSGGSRVYFIGSDNHVHELAWLVNQQGQLLWNTTDLTANAKDGKGNTPPPPISGSALASHDSGGSRVYFIGKDPTSSDNHVHELAWVGSSWNTTDLTYVTAPPNQSWMTDLANSTPGFADLKLSQICFPGTHDTGTYSLGSTFTTNPSLGPYKTIIDTINNISATIDKIPSISLFIDPLDWVRKGVVGCTRDLATSTHSDIVQQLDDGIRCLDLRVYFNHEDPGNPFYTYHGLVGVPIAPILSAVAHFITDVAPAGEIIYLQMINYWDDNTPNHGFNDDQLSQLSDLIWSYFPDKSKLFGPGDGPDNGSDLPNYSYSTITGSNGGKCSKVMLIMDSPLQTDQSKIWSTAQFSAKFSGSYANTEDRSQMISDQQRKSVLAKANSLAFDLTLILTPTNTDPITKLIEKSLYPAVLVLDGWVALVSFVPINPVGDAIVTALLVLASVWGGWAVPYTSLRDLSSQIFSSASPTVSALYQGYFQGAEYAAPSIIWMDFYEDHMETQAGRNVAQIVELAKTITLNR